MPWKFFHCHLLSTSLGIEEFSNSSILTCPAMSLGREFFNLNSQLLVCSNLFPSAKVLGVFFVRGKSAFYPRPIIFVFADFPTKSDLEATPRGPSCQGRILMLPTGSSSGDGRPARRMFGGCGEFISLSGLIVFPFVFFVTVIIVKLSVCRWLMTAFPGQKAPRTFPGRDR